MMAWLRSLNQVSSELGLRLLSYTFCRDVVARRLERLHDRRSRRVELQSA